MKNEKQLSRKIKQKEAHKILIKNFALCGGKTPFNVTVNYIGILRDTNNMRRLFGAKEYS